VVIVALPKISIPQSFTPWFRYEDVALSGAAISAIAAASASGIFDQAVEGTIKTPEPEVASPPPKKRRTSPSSKPSWWTSGSSERPSSSSGA
jgi:hypothetical protein